MSEKKNLQCLSVNTGLSLRGHCVVNNATQSDKHIQVSVFVFQTTVNCNRHGHRSHENQWAETIKRPKLSAQTLLLSIRNRGYVKIECLSIFLLPATILNHRMFVYTVKSLTLSGQKIINPCFLFLFTFQLRGKLYFTLYSFPILVCVCLPCLIFHIKSGS
jgi:hypothetical protein